MGDAKSAVQTAIATLAVIWVLNRFTVTRDLVQTAIYG